VGATANSGKPACLGGRPTIDLPQEEALRWPLVTGEDEHAVLEVLRSGRLAVHEVVADLERDYRAWLGVRHAVAHCNGTAAILAGLHALGIGPGDEVIVPSATWWSSVMPVLHCGGTPVFAESEEARLGLDPEDVEARVTERTRAIVVVHMFGMPSRMDDLRAVADRHGLGILEDAAHAHGALDRGRPAGTLGDVAVFSMQGNKLLPTAEGGMLVTDSDVIHERVVRLGHYERLPALEGSPSRRFAATGFGFKFRLSPLSAAVARVQLRHLPERNARRNANCILLSERLEELGVETFPAPAGVERVYFEFLVRCREERMGAPAAAIASALRAEGAQVEAPRYPLLHRQPVFTEGAWATIARVAPDRTYDPGDLPRTTRGVAELVRLPTFPNAGPELLDRYAAAFEKVLAHAAELPRLDS
jgi:dTDP-4-amino-4,6-dideoxygalactose transaminase